MEGNLETTNLLLGIMAAVSVLQGLVLIGVAVGAWIAYRRVTALMISVEERQIAPAMARVNGILDEVKVVANHVRADTERIEEAIRQTMGRVDHTAQRVRADVRLKTSWLVGAIRGVRTALETLRQSDADGGGNDRDPIAPLRTH